MERSVVSLILSLALIGIASTSFAADDHKGGKGGKSNKSPLSVITEHYPGEIVNFSYSDSPENPVPEDPVYQVPDNRILVIETIGIVGNAVPQSNGWLEGGVLVRNVSDENRTVSFSFFVTWPWEITEDNRELSGTKRVRIYAEPESEVILSSSGSVFESRVFFSGYLVPVRD